MNKIHLCAIVVALMAVSASVLSGCDSQADRVSYNISQQADNFNIVRQLTVINCIGGDVLFQMTGKLSIEADTTDNQLEIMVVEDLNLGENDVQNYRYTLNFNPNMWIQYSVDSVK